MNRLSNVEVTRPPRMTMAIGRTISRPGMSPTISHGQKGQSGGERRHQDWRQPFARAAQDQLRPKGFAFLCRQMLIVAGQHDAVAHGNPQYRSKPASVAEREDAAAQERRQHAARQSRWARSRRRQAPGASSRRLPAAGGKSRSPRQSPMPSRRDSAACWQPAYSPSTSA